MAHWIFHANAIIRERMSSEPDAKLRAWSHFIGGHALALRSIEARFKAAGLPPLSWYDVLLELERAEGRLRVGELGERLVVEPYNITRLLDRLAAEGLVKREKDASDGRVTIIVITGKGAALRRTIWPHYRGAVTDVLASLSDAEAMSFVRIMKKTIEGLRSSKTAREPPHPEE